MVQKVVTKKSFIGGRLVYPGEMVDVDAKGVVLPAGSTPVGAMSIAQLRATLEAREAVEGKAPAPEPEFGDNLADPVKGNTGTQELEIARIAPGSGNHPAGHGGAQQQLRPSGTGSRAGRDRGSCRRSRNGPRSGSGQHQRRDRTARSRQR